MKKVPIILIICIGFIVLGFYPTPNIDFRIGKNIVAEFALLFFVMIIFLKNRWLRLFMLWSIILCFSKYDKNSYMTLQTMIMYVMFYQVFYNKLKASHLSTILSGICIVTLAQCVLIFMQNWGVNFAILPFKGLISNHVYFDGWITTTNITQFTKMHVRYLNNPFLYIFPKDVICGIMSNPNMTSSALALGLPAFFRKGWRKYIPFVLFALIISRSLGGLIPGIAAIVLMCWLRYKRHRILIVVIGFFALCYYVMQFGEMKSILTGSGRYKYWRFAVEHILIAKPRIFWIGTGLGQFKVLFPAVSMVIHQMPVKYAQLHNEYLQLIIEHGIVGFTFAIGFILSLLSKLSKPISNVEKIAVVGIFVGLLNCGVNFLMHTNAAILLLVYFLIIDVSTKRTAADADNYYL